MKLVYINLNPNGAFSPLQTGDYSSVPDDMTAVITPAGGGADV